MSVAPASGSLVGIRGLDRGVITQILDRAATLRDMARRGETTGLLAGKSIGLVFMEPSTRTRFSFEMAARSLGAQTMVFNAAGSSTVKGETLQDTVRTLASIGLDAVVLRHSVVGGAHLLAQAVKIPVLNAGDGINEHPTQALLDALTLRDHLGSLSGKTIAVIGDVKHSRVARSNAYLLTKMGCRVLMSGPGTMCPPQMAALGVEVVASPDDAVRRADAVMMLRIQRERLGPGVLPSNREFAALFGLNSKRFSAARPGTLVLHPAPMNRGVEITDDVADGTSSVVFDQVANGVAVRMACLERAVVGTP